MKWSFVFVVLAATVGCAVDDPPEPFTGSWLVRGSGTTASLRGLHVVDADVAWASGSGGTFLRTVDGADTWEIGTVAGAEALDFRDVHAWDRDRALLLSAGFPARIYRTNDGGGSWNLMYENRTPGVFFNAVSFWDAERGIAVGDPIDGRFLIVLTNDGGETWTELPWESRPAGPRGRGQFCRVGNLYDGIRKKQRLVRHRRSRCKSLPLDRRWFLVDGGRDSDSFRPVVAGVFSLYFADERRGVAVGGDYLDEPNPAATAAVTVRRRVDVDRRRHTALRASANVWWRSPTRLPGC